MRYCILAEVIQIKEAANAFLNEVLKSPQNSLSGKGN